VNYRLFFICKCWR